MSKAHILLISVSICLVLIAIHVIPKVDRIQPKGEQFISIDTLEARVFEQYGEGDTGVEEMLYLTTGVHQDFMGTPDNAVSTVLKYDYFAVYCINLTDTQTIVYDINGKFITTVPFIEHSAWDEAMIADNL